MRDPGYVAARRVLLDALDAVRPHLDALVLVGAQSVYLHAGEADLAVAPLTTDGDITINPEQLADAPLLAEALAQAHFARKPGVVGTWQRSTMIDGETRLVDVDFLVPDSLGGAGRRGARLPTHGNDIARKAVGLEAALVDNDSHLIEPLEPTDSRRYQMAVSGPAACIVAKIHKIHERASDRDRARDKDALDVYRLLVAVTTEELARRLHLLRSNPLSQGVTNQAVTLLPTLFGSPTSHGTMMAVRAAGPLSQGNVLAQSTAALTGDLLKRL